MANKPIITDDEGTTLEGYKKLKDALSKGINTGDNGGGNDTGDGKGEGLDGKPKDVVDNPDTFISNRKDMLDRNGVYARGANLLNGGQTSQTPQIKPVMDNSGLINDSYSQLVNALKNKIQQSINDKNLQIGQLGQKYQGAKDQSELQKANDLRTALEQNANAGDRGGIGRQNALETQSAGENRLNDISIQQGKEEASLRNDISNLVAEGNIQEAQFMAQKLKDLIANNQYVDQTTYSRGQDSFNNNLNVANITGTYGTQRTIQGQQLDSQLRQRDIDNKRYDTEAEAQAKQQAVQNAWTKVNATGKVDAESAKILGIPEGTTTLEAQKYATDKALAEAGVTGIYNGQPTLQGREFDWNTDVKNNPQLAAAAQQLQIDKAQFEEWQKQAPQRLQILNDQVKQAKTTSELAALQIKIEQEKLAQEKVNSKYADKNAKLALSQAEASLANTNSEISYRAGQLGISREELALKKQELAKANSSGGSSKDSKPVNLKPYQDYITKYLSSDSYDNLGNKTGTSIKQKETAQYIVNLGLDDAATIQLLGQYGLPTTEAGIKQLLGMK